MNRKYEVAGPFKTFKEARKEGRELARYNHSYTAYITKTPRGYMVSQQYDNVFDFYVHRDGRVCKREEVEKENRKWNRHPERYERASAFVYRPRNREKGEDKKKYLREMSIRCICPF